MPLPLPLETMLTEIEQAGVLQPTAYARLRCDYPALLTAIALALNLSPDMLALYADHEQLPASRFVPAIRALVEAMDTALLADAPPPLRYP